MNRAISLLADTVVRKIAAGEVVERPASIVKELIENSLDSGATQITITVEQGGRDAITVTDNGCGISPEDLPRAVVCHATSKIRSFDDLTRITTFGFRGEALASISAVCSFTLRSRQAHAEEGAEIIIRNEEELTSPVLRPYRGPAGTVVRCEHLFAALPARKAFLRRAATEYGHILEVVQAFSLSCPHVHWQLQHGRKTTFEHRPQNNPEDGDLLSAWRSQAGVLLGIAQGDVLLAAEEKGPYAHLRALITPPGLDFPNGKRIWTFVNRRWIKDRTLHALILKGYHTHLLKHRYPACLVLINCDPSLVDINIHPAKKEVKFQYQKDLAQLIFKAFQRTLRQATWADPRPSEHSRGALRSAAVTPTFSTSPQPASSASMLQRQVGNHQGGGEKPLAYREPSAYRELSGLPQKKNLADKKLTLSSVQDAKPSHHFINAADEQHYAQGEKITSTRAGASARETGHTSTEDVAEAPRLPVLQGYKPPWSRLRYIGYFAKTYLLFEDPLEHQMLVVDQHAFHERIIFERLRSDPELLGKTQQFLTPKTITLSPGQVGQLAAQKEMLARIGFNATFEETTISVTCAPALLARVPLGEFLEALTTTIPTSTTASTQAWLMEDVLAKLACHSAIRAGEVLGEQEIRRLITEADGVDFYHNCPHGRRVFHTLKSHDVLRWFDRL